MAARRAARVAFLARGAVRRVLVRGVRSYGVVPERPVSVVTMMLDRSARQRGTEEHHQDGHQARDAKLSAPSRTSEHKTILPPSRAACNSASEAGA